MGKKRPVLKRESEEPSSFFLLCLHLFVSKKRIIVFFATGHNWADMLMIKRESNMSDIRHNNVDEWKKTYILVSISSTFYVSHFCTKVFCAVLLYLQFGFVILWQNNIGAKAARKMLMKLTTWRSCLEAFLACKATLSRAV